MKKKIKCKIKNLVIHEGESLRKVVYVNGKKFYLPLKAGKLQCYQVCHSRDLRKQTTQEAGR